MIFPAKQAKNRAMRLGIANKIEAFFASDLFQYTDFSDTFIFLCSNSGKTKEVILLLEYAKARGATCIALTTVADSILAKRADEKIILTCGFEKGVAATKSIIEQALIYDSLIFHLAKEQGKSVDLAQVKKDLIDTGEKMIKNMNVVLDRNVVDILARAKHYFMVGLDNGVAEEITLKAYEIAKKMALFYPDTHIVHGVEEAIDGDCAIIFDPQQFTTYLSDFEKFRQKTHCALFGIGQKTPIQEIDIETNKTFHNYCLIAGGWGLLRNIAHELQIDIDHPQKATKVGNPYED